MTRQMEDVRTRLSAQFPADKLEMKNGFAYVPWDDAMRVANDLFGAENLDVELTQPGRLEAVPCPDGSVTYGYSAVVRVTARVEDTEGNEVEMFRDGQGFNELEFSQERTGVRRDGSEYRIPPRALIDAAIKGAASGALLRALVLLGDAFGLYLYNDALRQAAGVKSTGSTTTTYTKSSGSANGDLGYRPSAAQMTYLEKAGVSAEQAATMPFAVWKKTLDDWFAAHPKKGAAKKTPVASGVTTAPEWSDEGDDLPF